MKEILKNGFEKLNIKLTEKMTEQFEKYYSFLIEYNKIFYILNLIFND